jgi:glycosyltransferase involved in cell wall biosynthesis
VKRLLILADARSIHTERWCRYFEKESVDVSLFSLERPEAYTPKNFYQGQSLTRFGAINHFLARRSFTALARGVQPDLVNAHFAVSYGWLASRIDFCPLVVTAWGSDLLLLPDKSFIHRRRVRKALERADLITVDNNNLFNAATMYTESEKILNVPMGVDRAFFDDGCKRDFIAGGPLKVIAPRGTADVYDPFTIVRAAKLLADRCEFHIELLSPWPPPRELEKAIASSSLQHVLTLRPFQSHDHYLRSLREYDVYLSASKSDSTAVSLLEAMAVGLFPVVTDIEGNRYWIDHDETGLLFTPGSPEALAEAIFQASLKRAAFERVAQTNRATIEGEAIWQNNMARIKNAFGNLSSQWQKKS